MTVVTPIANRVTLRPFFEASISVPARRRRGPARAPSIPASAR